MTYNEWMVLGRKLVNREGSGESVPAGENESERHHLYVTGPADPTRNCLDFSVGGKLPFTEAEPLDGVLAKYREQGYETVPSDHPHAEIDLWGGRDPRNAPVRGPHPGRPASFPGTEEQYSALMRAHKYGELPDRQIVVHASRKPPTQQLRVPAGSGATTDGASHRDVTLPNDVWESKLGEAEQVTHPRFGLKSELRGNPEAQAVLGYGNVVASLRRVQGAPARLSDRPGSTGDRDDG
jgi:hypothetical protein